MAKRMNVIGYKAFKDAVANYKKKDLVYCFFGGTKTNGKSWCNNCAAAEPVVLAAIEKYAKKHAVFIFAEVGNMEEFKSNNNPFKNDKKIQLFVIPTISRWLHMWRVESTNCAKDDVLKKFFSKHAD